MGFRFEIAKGHLETAVKTSLSNLGLNTSALWALNFLPRVYFYLGDFNRAGIRFVTKSLVSGRSEGLCTGEAVNFSLVGRIGTGTR